MKILSERKVRIRYYQHQSSLKAEDRTRFEELGVQVVDEGEGGMDVLFFGVCQCCPNSWDALSAILGHSGHALADGWKPIVLFCKTSGTPPRVLGMLHNPTPDQLLEAARPLIAAQEKVG